MRLEILLAILLFVPLISGGAQAGSHRSSADCARVVTVPGRTVSPQALLENVPDIPDNRNLPLIIEDIAVDADEGQILYHINDLLEPADDPSRQRDLFVKKFFETGLYKSYPKLLAQALLWQGTQPIEDGDRLTEYFTRYPDIVSLLEDAPAINPAPQMYMPIFIAARKFMDTFVESENSFVRKDLQQLLILRPYRNVVGAAIATQVDHISTGVGDKLAKSSELYAMIPAYNRFKLVKEHLRKIIGISKYEKIQDVVIHNENDKFLVIAVSSRPIGDAALNEYGFSAKVIDEFKATKSGSREVSFVTGGETFRATIRFQKVDPEKYIPKSQSSPNYDDFLVDGVLGGMVLFSSNFGDFAQEIQSNFRSYFKRRQFRFSTVDIKESAAAKKWVLDVISSGAVDYLIHEGHSEFATDVLSAFPETMHIEIGERTKNGRVVERIYLVGMGDNDESNIPAGPLRPMAPQMHLSLSHFELGNALNARPTVGNSFLLIEGACASAGQIGYLIQGVAAPGFLPIASNHTEDTFTGDGDTGTDILLDGIRKGQSYAQMTARLERLPDRTEAGFVFPNDPYYVDERFQDPHSLRSFAIAIHRQYEPMERRRPQLPNLSR